MNAQEQTDELQTVLFQAQRETGIASRDDYHRIVNLRALIRDMIKKITADRKPAIDSAKAHYEMLRDDLASKVNPLKTQDQLLGGKLVAWDTEQERLKKLKEQEQEAENQRLAQLAREMGNEGLADEIELTPTVSQKETPPSKETGVSFREVWGAFEVLDMKLVPIEYHMIDSAAVTKVIRALKGRTNIPGIKVLPPTKISVQRT